MHATVPLLPPRAAQRRLLSLPLPLAALGCLNLIRRQRKGVGGGGVGGTHSAARRHHLRRRRQQCVTWEESRQQRQWTGDAKPAARGAAAAHAQLAVGGDHQRLLSGAADEAHQHVVRLLARPREDEGEAELCVVEAALLVAMVDSQHDAPRQLPLARPARQSRDHRAEARLRVERGDPRLQPSGDALIAHGQSKRSSASSSTPIAHGQPRRRAEAESQKRERQHRARCVGILLSKACEEKSGLCDHS
eukprot:scaffold20169_cov69-Phaeocystis_antarctica.AAC.10